MRLGKIDFKVHFVLAAAFFLLTGFLFAQGYELNRGEGEVVVTVLPPRQGAASPAIAQDQLILKIDGKTADISKWERVNGSDAPVQLVVLIDDGARGSLGNQLNDIAQFIQSLPPSAEAGVAYMTNGRANMAGPLSKDHAATAHSLRVPTGQPGISGSPYFCLSDLAHHWPSDDASARRVVVMITNGVDNYELQYNPRDPYVQAAIHDALRSRISVYAIYWSGGGTFGGSFYAASDGQNLLALVTAATGGASYWQGTGNPVAIEPYFKDLHTRLENQYRLGFTAPLPNGPRVAAISLRVSGTSAKVVVPQKVFVGHPAAMEKGATQGN